MTDVQITGADIEAVASKLDGMADLFSEQERAALYAVFRLAGSSIGGIDDGGDVEGFALNAYRNSSFAFQFDGDQGILIGLNQGVVGGDWSGGFKFNAGWKMSTDTQKW